ncbi:outer membrane beta-barrel protein [Flavobacterium sp.]|uniref:outer membrane beta-barrel protein n=1 Tax=Flavobacterium sp. TaxID=239 RepID=UPI0028BF1E50|nr:outer membrane beta-barrel protein [Flavobacterium sp.]
MFQKLLLLLAVFFSVGAMAQNSVTLKGKIIEDKTKLPLEAVTVYFSKAKDSSLVDYTITDKNGNFSFKIKKMEDPLTLKVSMTGFQNHKVDLNGIEGDKDFGVITLLEEAKMLGEIIVKAEAPPIRIKKDTLEFNAASFKVRPDSNMETLLKQLPGVEIDNEGKITVNGKEVNQILVNGKPFFDKDGKIALQNLPADIINKVQVSDTKTKKEELSGQSASGNNTSINLTIDEDKNKGFFGKFMGGYGTDDRYESSALVNYFKNKTKFSVLASSNNINSTGFSMDEIFDNMGGGRNRSVYYNDNGSFGINGMRFGGGSGITQSDMVGINYSDEWFKNFEAQTSYFFSDQHNKNNRRSKQINFLPSGTFTTESESESRSDRFSHQASMELQYKIDSTTTIVYIPRFSNSSGKDREKSYQSSTDENDGLLNESTSETFDDSKGNNFENKLYLNKSFKRKGRFLNTSIETTNNKDEMDSFNNSATIFHQGTDPDDIRNQVRKSKNATDNYSVEVGYSEPLKDSLTVNVGMTYEWQKSANNRKAFDYDAVSDSYSIENDVLTNYIASTARIANPKAGFSINKKDFHLNVIGGTTIINFDANSSYLGINTVLNRNFVFPSVNSNIYWKLAKSKSIWAMYNYEYDLPSANQMMPVEDVSNPLNTFEGNENLDLNKRHYLYASFNDYDYVAKSGYSFYIGGNYYDSQYVSSSTIESNGKRTTTYENVQGNYYTWSGINFNKTIKKEAHTFKFGAGTGVNLSMNKGFTNSELYEAFGIRWRARANFTYEYGELLTIAPTYSYVLNRTNYTNYVVDNASNFQHQVGLQTTNYWPKNWVFGNDFSYNYNSNIADGFKKDFYLWNTSLSYSFLDKKFTAKVKVYDVLNQNQSATRTISATTIRDEQNTVLKRYAMFSLTYKIEKFAGKEKKGDRFMMH